MNRHIYLFALAAVALTACGGKDKDVILEGERISILHEIQRLHPNVQAQNAIVSLPLEQSVKTWTQTGGSANHALGHISLGDQVSRAWVRNLGAGSGKNEQIFHQPVVADGVIYTLLPNGTIRAVALSNGDGVWSSKIKNIKENSHFKYSGGLAIAGDKLIATTGTGLAIAFNRQTGDELWRRDILVPTRAAPAVYDDTIFVIGHNNQIFALKGENGAVLWTHNGIAESLTLLTAGAAAAAGDTVIVPYSSGEVYALNLYNGTYFWHDALALNVKADPFSALVDVTAPPVIDGETVFAVNHNGRLGAFNLEDGRRLWEVELSATQQPWVAKDLVFVTTENGQLVAIDRNLGKIRWVQPLNGLLPEKLQHESRFWGAPILAGGRLMTTSDDGYALALDPVTGKLIRIAEVAKNIRIAPLVVDGTLLFLTQDGKLVAYR